MEALDEQYHVRLSADTDVYSGHLYQQHVSSGFLAQKRNISFIFNTDGIPVFKSSKFTFWPLLLMINELPFRMRYRYGMGGNMLFMFELELSCYIL